MRMVFHPLVQQDWNQALDYYEEVSPATALSFDRQLLLTLQRIEKLPTRYSFYQGSNVFRRARIHGFPYLVIYRLTPGTLRVTVVKHEKRHPSYGMTRR